MFVIHCIDWGLVMDDEKENLVGIDDVYSDDFQTQVLLSDLSVLVETVDGWLESGVVSENGKNSTLRRATAFT